MTPGKGGKDKPQDLYARLKSAYADANLNRITASLLRLYRSGDHGSLREIAQRISSVVTVDDSSLSKCFSQLVVLYHPDKGESHRREIETLHADGNDQGLQQFSHVLLLGDIDRAATPPPAPEMADFTTEYAFESEEEAFGAPRESDDESFEDAQFAPGDEEYDHSFFHALKLKTYGTLAIELPTFYLRDMEEIEMADCSLASLDGIEHCVYATVIDISNNSLTDISELQTLDRITELYAGRNQIGYIDALRNLTQLRILDLSMNDLDDISALFDLEHLELVNITGNNIPPAQVERLRASGCTVIH